MFKVSNLTQTEALKHVREELGVPTLMGREEDLMILADLIRAEIMTWSGFSRTGVSQPIYITQLIRAVRLRVQLLLNQSKLLTTNHDESQEGLKTSLDQKIREILESLEDVGDVEQVDGGYWLPTPMRFVDLENEQVLILGSLTTKQLSAKLKAMIGNAGFARVCRRGELPKALERDQNYWATRESWLQGVSPPLVQWFNTLSQSGIFQTSASEFYDFEVYAPSDRPQRTQFNRWVPAREIRGRLSEPCLCRGRSYGTRFWLGKLAEGSQGLKLLAELPVRGGDVRRLQYALDLISSAPTTVRISREKTESQIELGSKLPSEGTRLLLALGIEVSEMPGRYPLRYIFRNEVFHQVQSYLEYLGIRLVHVENI